MNPISVKAMMAQIAISQMSDKWLIRWARIIGAMAFLSLLIPDPLPFVDEIILSLASWIIFAELKRRDLLRLTFSRQWATAIADARVFGPKQYRGTTISTQASTKTPQKVAAGA